MGIFFSYKAFVFLNPYVSRKNYWRLEKESL